jgi:hypothetical protein
MSEIVYPIDVTLPVQDAITMNEPQWRDHMRQHHAKLAPVVNAHLERASRSVAHPVIDFLFQYYPFAPAHLMRWTPGCGVLLAGDVPPALIALKEGVQTERGWRLDAAAFPERRREAAGWVLSLLENTETRAPRYGCFGLHEWAMVYRAPEVRHARMPLRFSVEETARIVESMPVNLEQRGCLHVNMDLYKWATQFYPWISSDIIADCFLLALQIREVDMRASPYDLLALGLSPVRIETDEGRTEYVTYQQQFAEAAIPLRERLINAFRLLRGLTGSGVQPAH